MIIPDGMDSVDVVLSSLIQFSVRYHQLMTTKPQILDSLRILSGHIDLESIKAAGLANLTSRDSPLPYLLDTFLRHAVEVDKMVWREQIWLGIELLHRMKMILMEMFAYSHGGDRAIRTFQSQAGVELQRRLGAILPKYDLMSLRASLDQLLQMVKQDLERFTDNQIQLSEIQHQLLQRLQS